MIAKTYQESYECAVKIGDYILKNNNYYVNDEEKSLFNNAYSKGY